MIENEEPVWIVSTFCRSHDPSTIARAAEILGRTVAGLALEGITCSLHVGPAEDDEEPG